MTILLFVLSLAVSLTPQAPSQDHHAKVDERGGHVMGFDQQHTRHSFLLYEDGGAIDIAVRDEADAANRDAIRGHLPHIAQMFGDGNYSAPMLIHDTNVPGTARMSALKSRIRFSYVETPVGGRLDIFTTDRAALDAVHEFLRFQIADHRTGDSGLVEKRR